MASADSQERGELSSTAGVAILAASVTAFVVEQASIASVNGWWNDELYSMWSTDPTFTFRKAFGYFGYDNTPPLFYSALYWMRRFIGLPLGHERISGYILSICAILLASAAVVSVSRRVGLTGFALAGIGAFLVSGPVSEYVPEVRAYLMAMAIVFVASWYTALAIEETSLRLPATCWAAIGVLAALTHLYSAIACGGLAVGLILLAAVAGRRDLTVPGLAMGLSASGTYAVWSFAMGAPKMWMTGHWIKFTFAEVTEAAAQSRQLEIGGKLAFALLLLLCACALMHRPTRLLTAAFGTAFAVFYILPILVSFKAPIIHERYWMIGGPALVVVLVFLARAGLSERIHKSHKLPLAIGAGAVALLISSSATGFVLARLRTEQKFFWGGTGIVAPLARNCPAASIHVLGNESSYALVAQLPVQMFVSATTHADLPALTLKSCPVLGWAEDLYAQHKTVTTEKDMLNLLQIDASPADVDIRRQSTGYVVLQRNP